MVTMHFVSYVINSQKQTLLIFNTVSQAITSFSMMCWLWCLCNCKRGNPWGTSSGLYHHSCFLCLVQCMCIETAKSCLLRICYFILMLRARKGKLKKTTTKNKNNGNNNSRPVSFPTLKKLQFSFHRIAAEQKGTELKDMLTTQRNQSTTWWITRKKCLVYAFFLRGP